MKKLLVSMVAATVVACTWGAPVTAAPLFLDTFELVDFSAGAGTVEEDVNDELPGPRQPGDVGSTYTEGGSVFLNANSGPNGSDVVLLRTTTNVNPSVSTLDLDRDFGPDLAGKKYSVKYEGRVDHLAGIASDNWQAFGIGDTSADAPNGGNADFGILLRLGGGWQAFLDGTPVAAGGGTGLVPGSPYSVQFDFDETLANPTVTATVDASLGPVVIGTLPIDALSPGTAFESGGRFMELRVFQSSDGNLLDTRIDNLTIEIVPEPSSLLLLMLSGISCLAFRRR